jgi:hypothetical protein
LTDIIFIFLKVLLFTIDLILYVINEVVCWHWAIRKTYQTSLYRFNAFHEYNLWRVCFYQSILDLEFSRWETYTYLRHFHLLRLLTSIMYYTVVNYWYSSGLFLWIYLTYFLYYYYKARDLGPSHEVFAYSSEIDMGFYRTIGPWLLFTWALWTFMANFVFVVSIYLILTKVIFVHFVERYWYHVTLYSCIEMYFVTFFTSVYETSSFIWINYDNLVQLEQITTQYNSSAQFLKFSQWIVTTSSKSIFLWFPWQSFFNYLTIFGLLYTLTLLAIYNSDNAYYLVIYMIFLVFLFATNLVILDLDIFAGLLLLIESVVILMLFFLIIYLTPNINFAQKNQKWKVYIVLFIMIFILSLYSYNPLGEFFFYQFSITSYFYDDFYEALHELFVNDLMGIFVTMYITNSLLLVVVGFLLLIASIICVVLVSFFTKLRNYSFKNFLSIFSIIKTCYSFIFLRKQNLAKQGRSTASTRIFEKKTFDTAAHAEYRKKQEIFEKKKKDTQKDNI